MDFPKLAIVCIGVLASAGAAQPVGVRPYELDWAGRTQDDHPPLVDFEDLGGWTVEVENAHASLEPSREQRIWGQFVGKVTYRVAGPGPKVRLRPPRPLPIPLQIGRASGRERV